MMGRQGRRLLFSALMLALSLSVSYCSQNQSALKVRGLKPDEAATLTAAYHPWERPPANPERRSPKPPPFDRDSYRILLKAIDRLTPLAARRV